MCQSGPEFPSRSRGRLLLPPASRSKPQIQSFSQTVQVSGLVFFTVRSDGLAVVFFEVLDICKFQLVGGGVIEQVQLVTSQLEQITSTFKVLELQLTNIRRHPSFQIIMPALCWDLGYPFSSIFIRIVKTPCSIPQRKKLSLVVPDDNAKPLSGGVHHTRHIGIKKMDSYVHVL
jgi:hypothetical protein